MTLIQIHDVEIDSKIGEYATSPTSVVPRVGECLLWEDSIYKVRSILNVPDVSVVVLNVEQVEHVDGG